MLKQVHSKIREFPRIHKVISLVSFLIFILEYERGFGYYFRVNDIHVGSIAIMNYVPRGLF